MTAAERSRFQDHLDACPRCARYDRVVRGGAEVLHELPVLEPSDDFLPRLQHQIYHLEMEGRGPGRHGSEAPLLLTLGIAAVIGLVAWAPVMRPRTPVVELPPVTAHAPHPPAALPSLFHRGPLLKPPHLAETADGVAPGAPVQIFQPAPLGSLASYRATGALH